MVRLIQKLTKRAPFSFFNFNFSTTGSVSKFVFFFAVICDERGFTKRALDTFFSGKNGDTKPDRAVKCFFGYAD